MTTSSSSAATTSAPVQSHQWTIDPSHSAAEFSVRHMMVSTVKGRFTNLSGTIAFDPANVAASHVSAVIEVSSINTHDEQRDTHLRSGDFFEAEKFPTITFESTRVEPVSAEHARIVGNLTIRDTPREVVLDAELNGEGTNPWGKQV